MIAKKTVAAGLLTVLAAAGLALAAPAAQAASAVTPHATSCSYYWTKAQHYATLAANARAQGNSVAAELYQTESDSYLAKYYSCLS